MELLVSILSLYAISGDTSRITVNREPFLQDSESVSFMRATLIVPDDSSLSTTRTLSRSHLLKVLRGLPMLPYFLGWQTIAIPWQRHSGMLLRLGGLQADCPYDCAHWGTSAMSKLNFCSGTWHNRTSYEMSLMRNYLDHVGLWACRRRLSQLLIAVEDLPWVGQCPFMDWPSTVGVKKGSRAWAARQAG